MTLTKIYDGNSLLDMIFEFIEMTPDSALWTIKSLENNKPRLIRLKQINALIKALYPIKGIFSGKGETIHTIMSGDFLKKKDITMFSELIAFMTTMVAENEKRFFDDKIIHIEQLQMPYLKLFEYKKQLRGLLTFNSGWIEASSIESRFIIHLTNSVTNKTIDTYAAIDEALELFINPKKLTFTQEELINKYNFPTEDLKQIDFDNW